MSGLLQMVEKELNIPKKRLIEEGVKRFLEVELKNLSIEIRKLSGRYGVNSFDVTLKLPQGEKIPEKIMAEFKTFKNQMDTQLASIAPSVYAFAEKNGR